MDVIVITGAPGVGKTVLLKMVSDALPGKSAWLDGDCVGKTKPIDRTREQLDLIQDNICACAQNFAEWGAEYFVACYGLPNQERVERISGLLRKGGHCVHVIALIADDEVLKDRHKEKGDWAACPEYLEKAVRCNNGVRALEGVKFIDTTNLSLEKVTEKIVSQVNEGNIFA